MYFTKDSESMKDFDDEVDSDWDWDESDSSMDLSQFNDDENDNNMAWESAKVADVRHTYMDNSGGVGEGGQHEQSHRTSSGLSRQHASAPCLLNMTYEVPLKDDDKGKGSSPPNNRRPSRKERNNPHILSFHG